MLLPNRHLGCATCKAAIRHITKQIAALREDSVLPLSESDYLDEITAVRKI
jgi:hypothetical protein